jgi:hypothetical protein
VSINVANAPILITRAQIGKGPGIVLISFAAPAGELGKGAVGNVEVVRIAMTHTTFKELANLFSYTASELEHTNVAATPNFAEGANKRTERSVRSRASSEGH